MRFSRVAIVGGNSQIARHLHELLIRSGTTPVALVRSESQRSGLETLGAEVRRFDIERDDASVLAGVIEGCDAVVFAAGGGPDGNIDRKRTVDLGGSLKTIEAAQVAGIARIIQLSAVHVDDPVAAGASPVWTAYVEAKRDADVAVRESGLDWTIVRPGSLTDEPGTGLVRAAPRVGGGRIPRADVAAVLAATLEDDTSVGKQFELVGGEDPVAEAVAALG